MVVKNDGPVFRMRVPSAGVPDTLIGKRRPAAIRDACESVAWRTPGIASNRRCRSAYNVAISGSRCPAWRAFTLKQQHILTIETQLDGLQIGKRPHEEARRN